MHKITKTKIGEEMKFYRYVAVEYAVLDADGDLVSPSFPSPKIELKEYEMVSETPCGYWIVSDISYPDFFKKWVSKTSLRRFAYPDKASAMTNFIKRTERRIELLEYQLQSCKSALWKAKAYDIAAAEELERIIKHRGVSK